MDPFASPETEPARPTVDLDIGRAVSEAVGALMANIPSAVGVVILAPVALLVSMCFFGVGLIPVLPLISWGIYAWLLQSLDGKGQVGTLFSGSERFGHVFMRMWGLFLAWFLISLPLMGVMMALTLPAAFEAAVSGQQPDPIQQTLVISVVSLVFALVVVRLMLTPFFIVERDLGALDAFQRSWEVTRGQWGRLIVLQLLFTFLNLPAQVLSVGLQVYTQDIDQSSPEAALEALPVLLATYTATLVLSAAVVILGQLFFASAYRQLSGPAPQAA